MKRSMYNGIMLLAVNITEPSIFERVFYYFLVNIDRNIKFTRYTFVVGRYLQNTC